MPPHGGFCDLVSYNGDVGGVSLVILFKKHPPNLYKSTKLKKYAPDVLTLRPGLDKI